MTKKSYIHYIFATLVVLSVFSVLMISVISSVRDPYVIFSFVPAAIILTVVIFFESINRAYSLHLIHILLLYVLMVLAPFYQYSLGSFPWVNEVIFFQNNDVYFANFLVLLWVCMYLFGYWLGRLFFHDSNTGIISSFLMQEITNNTIKILLYLSILILIYMFIMGYGGVYTRFEYNSIAFKGGKIHYLILSYFLRVVPYVFLVILLLLKDRKDKPFNGSLLIAAIFIFYINNPFAASRFWTVTILLAILCAFHLRKNKTAFPLLILGFLGVMFMPIVNAGRYYKDIDPSYILDLTFRNLLRIKAYLANSGDFDAYSNLMRSFIFVSENGITWGHQLLGSLFFWVPRVLWEDKPIGSGHKVAKFYELSLSNISFPLPAEGYINFGVIGVIMFAISFGLLLNFLDSKYYQSKKNTSAHIRFIDVFYIFLLGMVIFMTRGDLMASFSYTIALSFAVILSTVLLPRIKLRMSSR